MKVISVLTDLSHGLLVHIICAAATVGEQGVSLQGLQGFGGHSRAIVGLQSLRTGSLGLQQPDDVLSGLRRHNNEGVLHTSTSFIYYTVNISFQRFGQHFLTERES